MKVLGSIWRFFVFTNLLIASAAGAQVLLTYDIFRLPYDVNIVCLEFTATLLLYNLSIWLSKPTDFTSSPYARTRWIFGNMCIFWGLSAIASLVLLYVLTQVYFKTLLYLGFIGLLSLAYAMPIVKIQGVWKSFRHVPYIKVFHIAFIWSLSTVGLVYVEEFQSLDNIDWLSLLYLLSCKFLFILMVTLPFDIRDMKQDSYYHLKTIPLALGEIRAKKLCYMLGLLHMLLVINMPATFYVKIGLIACDILVLILFEKKIFKEENSFLNVYLLDLVLVLQFLFCFLTVQIAYYFIR